MRINKTILLIALFAIFGISSIGAQIQGIVVDANTKEPIIGATVQIPGTTTGNITDFDGNFSLSTSLKSTELEVRYMGYKTKKIKWIDNGKSLNIELNEDSELLDELVVIGYGVQKKSDLTGAISSIKTDELKSAPSSTLSQALQGKASGVEVVRSSGAPGSGTSIRIRGMGTINDSEPLYVVDGTTMERIDFLSSDDIESIEILKDAASAAIYGSRAANGVVLITTKNGKKGSQKVNINFSSYFGFQNVAKEPKILSKEQYPYFNDFVRNIPQYTNPTSDKWPLGPNGNNGQDWMSALTGEGQKLVENGENYWDLITRTGPMYKANLSVSGGDKDFNYYTSGGMQRTDGIVKESNYERANFNVKINNKISKTISTGFSIAYSREDKVSVPEGNWGVVQLSMNTNPLRPIFDPVSGSYSWTTPVEALRRNTYKWGRDNLLAQVNLDWDITKGLRFSTRANYSLYKSSTNKFHKYNNNPLVIGSIKSIVEKKEETSTDFGLDNILNYLNSFGKHNLNLMVGQTMEMNDYSFISESGTAYGGYDDEFDSFYFAKYDPSLGGLGENANRLSAIARASYDYDGKYLFQANFRADASSKFSKKNRVGTFPSLSVGWKINAEDFMKEVSWISLLKVRAGWGILGNDKISNYAYLDRIGYQASWNPAPTEYILGDGTPVVYPAYKINQIGNPDIKWESTNSYNLALDFNAFNNRLTTTVDFFLKNTKDMIIAVPVPISTGFITSPLQNAGEVENKGVEMQLNWKDQIGKFRYEVGGNLTFVQNRVKKLGSGGDPIYGGELKVPSPLGYVNKTMIGAPIASFYGWKTDGLMQPEDFDSEGNSLVPTFASTAPYRPGDMKFVDVNKDGVIDDNDKTLLGTPHPSCYYGFNVNVGYKDFDLNMFFQGVAGNKIYNVTKYFMYSSVGYNGTWSDGDFSNVAADYFDKVYRPEPNGYFRDHYGANTNGTVPTPRTDQSRNEMNFRNSDFYLENGSYLRLKNIQLTYTLPIDAGTKNVLKGFRAYATVSNLFTITKYTGLDPEVGQSSNLFNGIDLGTYPQCRSYMLGIIVDF